MPNHIRERRRDLLRIFEEVLNQAERELDEQLDLQEQPPPRLSAEINFNYPHVSRRIRVTPLAELGAFRPADPLYATNHTPPTVTPSDEARAGIQRLRETLSDTSGRAQLGQAMSEAIRERLRQQSEARPFFPLIPNPPEEPPEPGRSVWERLQDDD